MKDVNTAKENLYNRINLQQQRHQLPQCTYTNHKQSFINHYLPDCLALRDTPYTSS